MFVDFVHFIHRFCPFVQGFLASSPKKMGFWRASIVNKCQLILERMNQTSSAEGCLTTWEKTEVVNRWSKLNGHGPAWMVLIKKYIHVFCITSLSRIRNRKENNMKTTNNKHIFINQINTSTKWNYYLRNTTALGISQNSRTILSCQRLGSIKKTPVDTKKRPKTGSETTERMPICNHHMENHQVLQ